MARFKAGEATLPEVGGNSSEFHGFKALPSSDLDDFVISAGVNDLTDTPPVTRARQICSSAIEVPPRSELGEQVSVNGQLHDIQCWQSAERVTIKAGPAQDVEDIGSLAQTC